MKILLPFVFSAIWPGTGQFFFRDYLKGFLLLLSPIIISVFIPQIPFIYPYLIAIIFSLADIYLKTEKREGN